MVQAFLNGLDRPQNKEALDRDKHLDRRSREFLRNLGWMNLQDMLLLRAAGAAAQAAAAAANAGPKLGDEKSNEVFSKSVPRLASF